MLVWRKWNTTTWFKQHFYLTCCGNRCESTLQKLKGCWRQNHKLTSSYAHSHIYWNRTNSVSSTKFREWPNILNLSEQQCIGLGHGTKRQDMLEIWGYGPFVRPWLRLWVEPSNKTVILTHTSQSLVTHVAKCWIRFCIYFKRSTHLYVALSVAVAYISKSQLFCRWCWLFRK